MAAGWESLDHAKLELADTEPVLASAFLGVWREAQEKLGFLHVSEIPYLACQLLEDQTVDVELDVLVVDEYQDLNRAEVKFLELLSAQLNIIAIGDDDQSIYGWRQAAPEALLEFCDQFAAGEFILTACFRCGADILAPANAVIASAPSRPAKPSLTSCRTEPGEFVHLRFDTSDDEFDHVAEIVRHRIESGVAPSEIAILVRSSASRFRSELQRRLDPSGITLTSQDWAKAVLNNEPEVRRLLVLGRLVTDPEDSIAWLSLLNNTRGIGWPSLFKIYLEACGSNRSLYEELGHQESQAFPCLTKVPSDRIERALSEVREVLAEMHGESEGVILGPGGWGEWLLDHGDPSLLSDDARNIFNTVGGTLVANGETALYDFINQLPALAVDLADDDPDSVRLMTMASSKGLTVNTAILLSVDDSTLPHPSGGRDEERRILYVAMTRATDFVVVSFAETRSGSTATVGTSNWARSLTRRLLSVSKMRPLRPL